MNAPELLTPEEAQAIPLAWTGDVVVVGGGSAGCAAAVAAARSGARTLLIEAMGYLGGTGASVLDTFYGFYAPGRADRVVGGVGWELCERLLSWQQAFERPNTYGAGTGVTYEPEALKVAWDELTVAAGVDTLLHALVSRVVVDDGRITDVIVETRAGSRRITGTVFIDASGDAELAWRCGAALERPDAEHRVQPLTATFRLGNVDVSATPSKVLHQLMRDAAASGEFELPRTEGSAHRTVLPGVVHTNMTRVSNVNPLDPWELSAAEREGRKQTQEYIRFLRFRVPGYADSYLIGTSTRIGVRESRRLIGQYVLTREDVLVGRSFADAIARCGAPIEDHGGGSSTIWKYVGGDGEPTGVTYGIPYRCLLPNEVSGLLVAGRCLSATHDAHASVRSMAQCMAMGQAAGTAAALAVATDSMPSDVDTDRLRAMLEKDGALL
ncbi:FAD-dependent oxidoreductase [Planosporangium thailandense]|uniref:FAD-dependent oxidoreductase n=1 Tax=Planosporangium thailandense TaxID=765197 RepID=A0ABX0Y496_9ACTN|nr:FAD-dependent oxidoreductase [Planosporangium thailandense]NJC72911.1 FAD-dependent oxidoreductase [Planosporangium thailandense]